MLMTGSCAVIGGVHSSEAGQVATAMFLAGSAIHGQSFPLIMSWLCLTGFAAYFWPAPFWALPTITLTSSAAAVSIGLINMLANLAGYLGNHFNGWLRSQNASESTCLLFLAACYLMGGVLVSFVKVQGNAPDRARVPEAANFKT